MHNKLHFKNVKTKSCSFNLVPHYCFNKSPTSTHFDNLCTILNSLHHCHNQLETLKVKAVGGLS